jgi:hypothetical protein
MRPAARTAMQKQDYSAEYLGTIHEGAVIAMKQLRPSGNSCLVCVHQPSCADRSSLDRLCC